jgi:hypothetical protein
LIEHPLIVEGEFVRTMHAKVEATKDCYAPERDSEGRAFAATRATIASRTMLTRRYADPKSDKGNKAEPLSDLFGRNLNRWVLEPLVPADRALELHLPLDYLVISLDHGVHIGDSNSCFEDCFLLLDFCRFPPDIKEKLTNCQER